MLRRESSLCIVMTLILFFSKQAEAKIINKDFGRFKRFFQYGENIDLNHELELSDYVGGELLEVRIRYNMLRSKLGIDWLINGKTVSHSILKKGLLKKASYNFRQPITSSCQFGLRLTGNEGQLQLFEITAEIDDSKLSRKEDKKEDKKTEAEIEGDDDLSSGVKIEPGAADWMITAEEWSIEDPDEINNKAAIEIDGVMVSEGIIIAGPGLAIERVPGFDKHGRPDEHPGTSMELPFIFEYSGEGEKELENIHEYFKNGQENKLRAISVVTDNAAGDEEFRWNLFGFGPESIETGQGGRKRYVCKHIRKPDKSVAIERNPAEFNDEKSFNPETDKLVEIEGVLIAYAPVEIDETNRTLTIALDYVEGGRMWSWVRETAEGRGQRRPVMIADWKPAEGESNRTVYFNCFPVLYRQFTGFGQSDKAKEKVVMSYGWKEEGR